MSDEVLYDYQDLDLTYELTKDGKLFVTNVKTGKKTEQPWFRNGNNGPPWIPAKRKSFVSSLKMGIRDGDYDDLK